ncbi:MAG TPA: lytic transglycosylase domain-containing protein [Terriglobales bacterium]|nr:lytic transglycosylase domain-containing protein [Terriglobales bacterium]
MQKNLKLALMASPAIATLLSLTPCAVAGSNTPITATTDDSGHKVYVNDVINQPAKSQGKSSALPAQTFRARPNGLVFWSTTDHRWKPVPHVNVIAAKSAAAEVDSYLDKPGSLQNSLPRNGFTQAEIDEAIEKAASRHNVDPNLVRALVKVESNFNPNAVSRKGAMGLMQLMPQTARQMKLSNPFNPEENIDAGVRHLKDLLDNYGGDVRLSLAAYNAGMGAVARSSGIPRYAETRNYVKRITELYGGSGSTYFSGASHDPVRVERDSRGVLYISNTD